MVKKPFEDDDPMELTGVALPEGDMEEEAAEALVEEFVMMGFDDEQLLHLFKNPFYTKTHQIYLQKGEEYMRALIEKTRLRWRVPRGNDPREPNE